MKIKELIEKGIISEKLIIDYKFKFGTSIGLLEPSGNSAIGDYELSNNIDISKKQIEDIMQKGINENKDYLLDFAKKNGKQIKYKKYANY